MDGKRIIQLAKDYKITPNRIIEFLNKFNSVSHLNHHSKIDDSLISLLDSEFGEFKNFKKSSHLTKLELISKSQDFQLFLKYKKEQEYEANLKKLSKLHNDYADYEKVCNENKDNFEFIRKKKFEIEVIGKEIVLLEFRLGINDELSEDELKDVQDDYNEIWETNDELEETNNSSTNTSTIDFDHFQDWGRYTQDNPWIDVFGPGDEAETTYWNCD